MFDPGRIGRSLRAIRVRQGLRQADVARRAACSRSFVSKVERGLARSGDIRRIERLCVALGADLDVRVRWQGEGLDRLLDEGHATIIDRFVPVLRAAGWLVALEVTFNEFGDRGSIDILAWHAALRSLLVVEIKSIVPDAQGTLAPLDRKVRAGPKLARARGWDPLLVSRLIVIGDTTTNRVRVRRFTELFEAALPMRGREVRRWLGNPDRAISGLCFLPDSTRGGTRRSTAGRTRVNRPRGRVRPAG
ncbi:MAG TPA: helix-turn-helix transcriptional regulator [Candidatus Dormibacteraeota bacterium]|nr:helix-turn-helix transcriptional regulator [Candidatus Dormibacteraeota bacterium]